MNQNLTPTSPVLVVTDGATRQALFGTLLPGFYTAIDVTPTTDSPAVAVVAGPSTELDAEPSPRPGSECYVIEVAPAVTVMETVQARVSGSIAIGGFRTVLAARQFLMARGIDPATAVLSPEYKLVLR